MRLPFTPMLLGQAETAFASDEWLYQVKWDGVRNLTLVQGPEVRHWSRRGRDRTPCFPEFAGLAKPLSGRRTVLDGEIITLRGGVPSFSAVLERDLAGGRPDPRRLIELPATLMLFDLLEYGDQALYDRPVEERSDILRTVVADDEAWQVVTSFPGASGPDLFRSAAASGLEGVVAKRLGSGYVPGERSKNWLKIKRRQRLLAVVCGYTAPAGRQGGILLGGFRQGRLVYIGRVGSGITAEQHTLLRSHLRPAARPFGYEPVLRDRFGDTPGPVVWTEPRITAEVEFGEWTDSLKLRDPVLIRFSVEPPEAAVIQ